MSRVDQWGKREALKKGKSKIRPCIYREMDAYRGRAEWSFPVEWHDFRSQARAQGPMRVGCRGLE